MRRDRDGVGRDRGRDRDRDRDKGRDRDHRRRDRGQFGVTGVYVKCVYPQNVYRALSFT